MMILRPYQVDFIANYECATEAGRKRIIGVAPTGAGKTIIASEIIRAAVAAHRRVLVLAHRREIIAQTSAKLHEHGIGHGIIQAGFSPRPLEPVQLASVQTLHRRGIHSDVMDLPIAHLLIVDECHHSTAQTWRDIINAYPDATLLGLTATPCRGDGRGLGGIFETLIECPQVGELIKQGYLLPTRTYAPVNPDLTGVRIQAGDYVESQLAARMDQPKLVGDIVHNWHKHGEGRRTVIFATGVGHSIHIRDEFVRLGVRAEHIDGATPKPERDATLSRLGDGTIQIVTNCMVLTEGWDMPDVGCCILARPTRKMGLYRQMIGRVLRPAKDKTDAIVIDHSGAVFRHGFAEDPVEWTLDPERCAENRKHEKRSERGSEQRMLECSQCSALRTAGEPCPHCGFLPQRPPRSINVIDGELGLVEGGRAQGKIYSPEERSRWHSMLSHIAHERSYKPGWVAHQYRKKFGSFPAWGSSPQPIAPTPEVRSWVRSRQIAYARAQAGAP
jgi:superfamily II DNA or RNA helicase